MRVEHHEWLSPWLGLVLALTACGDGAPPSTRSAPPTQLEAPPASETPPPVPSTEGADDESDEGPPPVTIPPVPARLGLEDDEGPSLGGVLVENDGPCLLSGHTIVACWRRDALAFVAPAITHLHAIPHSRLAIHQGGVVVAREGTPLSGYGEIEASHVAAYRDDLVLVGLDGTWHVRTDHDDRAIEIGGEPVVDAFGDCALTESGVVHCLRDDPAAPLEAVRVGAVPGATRIVTTAWSDPPLGLYDDPGPAALPASHRFRARCVLDAEGRLLCSTQRDEAAPPPFRPLPALGRAHVVSVDVAARHLCALEDGGEVRCLDLGAAGRASTPVSDARAIAVDESVACARTRGDRGSAVRCWPLGPGSPPGRDPRVARIEPLESAWRVAGGSLTSGCALAYGVLCWDANERPALAPPGGGCAAIRALEGPTMLSVSRNGTLACAALADGHVACWGHADPLDVRRGPLDAPASSPRRVALPQAHEVGVAGSAVCAALSDGGVACTGAIAVVDDRLVLGGPPRREPLRIEGLDHVMRVFLHDDGTLCVVHDESAPGVSCVGAVFDDDGTAHVRGIRIPETSDVRWLHVDDEGVCALRQHGELDCWAPHAYGIGEVDLERRDVPPSNWVSDGCVLTTMGAVLCGDSGHRFSDLRAVGAGLDYLDPYATASSGCATGERGTWCWSSTPVSQTPDDVAWRAGGVVTYAIH